MLGHHSVVTGLVVRGYSHIVNLTTLKTGNKTVGLTCITRSCQALIGHSQHRVGAGTPGCTPHHHGSAHIVTDREIPGNTRL